MSTAPSGVVLEEEALPALYGHCVATYDAMFKKSSKVLVPTGSDGNDHNIEMLVYEGFLTKLITEELHLSVPFYSSVRRALQRMGCITQLKRGGGNAKSQWELHRAPTEALYLETEHKKKPPRNVTETAQIKEQIAQMNIRLGVVEDLLSNITREEAS